MAIQADARDIAPAQTDVPPTPASAVATIKDVLPLNELALIGLFGTPDNRSALLRRANGEILRVTSGDSTPKGQVVGIDDSAIHLAYFNKVRVLAIPGG